MTFGVLLCFGGVVTPPVIKDDTDIMGGVMWNSACVCEFPASHLVNLTAQRAWGDAGVFFGAWGTPAVSV